MAEVAHVFICERAYEDDHGLPSVIGMFDHLWAPAFPFARPEMVIALQMVGHQHETFDVTVEVINPRNQVIGSERRSATTPLLVTWPSRSSHRPRGRAANDA